MQPRTVALYGGNLVVSAIGVSLEETGHFQVRQLDPSAPNLLDAPDAPPPDLILFDLAKAATDFAISLLRDHPDTTLIGVDLESRRMLVLSAERSRLLTIEDLVRVLEEVKGGEPVKVRTEETSSREQH